VDALSFLIHLDDYRTVSYILRFYKEGVKVEDENGDTPLHMAAANGYSLTVKELLKNKADCEARLVSGWL